MIHTIGSLIKATYDSILEGSLLLLLCGSTPKPGKDATSTSVQNKSILINSKLVQLQS